MVHFDGHRRKFPLYWLDIVREMEIEYLPTAPCALCTSNFLNLKIENLTLNIFQPTNVHFLQFLKIENRKSKLNIFQPNDVHFLQLFLQFPSQPSRRAANAIDSKGAAAKLLIQRPQSTWKTPQTDDCPSALGRNSKVGQCQASKARDPTWKKTLEFEAWIRPPRSQQRWKSSILRGIFVRALSVIWEGARNGLNLIGEPIDLVNW